MDLDTTSSRDVWLVKVPKYLATAWKKAPQSCELGRLQIPKSGQGGKLKLITDPKLQKAADEEAKIPSEHVLTLQPMTRQRMMIISQIRDSAEAGKSSSSSDKISIEGNVKDMGVLRPNADLSYMSMKSNSFKQAAKPNRVTKILDKAVTSYKPRGAAQLAHEADLRKKKEEAKKLVREDKEIVQGRLFNAFEKQQYYNIKDLVRITNQSIPYLKEILKEICNYCSNGTHKNMWELKPEYRHYKSASGSQARA